MFGENRVLKQEINNGRVLRIVDGSPFYTIQGEGPRAGTPAIFIRLHGCNLRCWFCDTQFDSVVNPSVSVERLVEAVVDMAMLSKLKKIPELVVITGGEPLRQSILPLCRLLSSSGFKVQIETAGTLWIDGLEEYAEIICSPKTPKINEHVLKHARAFKYIISASDTFEGFIPITQTQPGNEEARPLAAPRNGAEVYLSPMDEYDEIKNRANRELVADLAMVHGVKAGLQMHKFLDVE